MSRLSPAFHGGSAKMRSVVGYRWRGVAIAPVAFLVVLAVAVALAVRILSPSSRPGTLTIVNNVDAETRVTFCPQQDCRSPVTVVLSAGQRASFTASQTLTPDSITVTVGLHKPQCTLDMPDVGHSDVTMFVSDGWNVPGVCFPFVPPEK